MADTFGDLVSEIVDESRRSMSTTIQNLILDAIAHYETERFFFNEFRNQTFSLSSSQTYYTSVDNSMIPRIMELDRLTLTVDSSYSPTLPAVPWDSLEDLDAAAASTGQPTAYAYWGQTLRFYPQPDGGYTVRLAGVFQDTSLSASTDANGWTRRGSGKELIKQRAKSLLYSEFLRDDQNAARASARERDAYDVLKKRTSRLQSTGDIVPDPGLRG